VQVTETDYDTFDRPVAVTHADGSMTRTVYDAAGKLRYQFDELHNRSETVYDEYGRVAKIIAPDPDGPVNEQLSPISEFQYDAVGNVVAVVDPRGFTTHREYDLRNRLVTETDATGAVRRSIYDAAGQMVASIDPRGFAASTRYDDRGRIVRQQLVDPDGAGPAIAAVTTHKYDDVGNLEYTTDPQGVTTWFEYDSLNRLREESRYDTLIADDASESHATFAASAGSQQAVLDTIALYGRDITYWNAPVSAPQATWTFSGLDAGDYRISMTWFAGASYDPDASIQIYRNGVLVDGISPVVNQTQSPGLLFDARRV
jgi:YD repeat-containing protein